MMTGSLNDLNKLKLICFVYGSYHHSDGYALDCFRGFRASFFTRER